MSHERTRSTTRVRPIEWVAAVVVPVVVGGVIGGPLGGIATVVVLVPWFQHLLNRAERSRPEDDATCGHVLGFSVPEPTPAPVTAPVRPDHASAA
jgi:hypothetical protein